VEGQSLLVVKDGREVRELLRLTAPEMLHPFPGSLAWTADGRYVLFSKVVKEERQVWRIPSQGGRAKPIGVHGDAVEKLRSFVYARLCLEK
jgi:hypothetical protein